MTNSPQWQGKLQARLLAWFRQQARDLPWRREPDPYRVWISEVMLQQTQVVTVIPYFERFLQRFPNVTTLAAADESDVLRLWEGLGYYRRARQLHAAAKRVVAEHGGEFPTDPESVRKLPGIGRYTAGAILSIALGQRQPILEANTIRVFSRLLAYRDDPHRSAGQRTLWAFAESILPDEDPGTLNQALMELGSEICTPREPACDRCPVRDLCPTRRLGLQAEIPVAKRPPRYEDVHETAVVVRRRETVLLRQCGEGERWAGLWDFPRWTTNGQSPVDYVRELTGIAVTLGERLTTLKYGVTRFRITLDCHTADYERGRLRKGGLRWVPTSELVAVPLSVTGRKIARLLA